MKKLLQIISAVMPFVIIGALLYAGIFVKPGSKKRSLPVPVLSKRDVFYGIQVPSDRELWAVGHGGKIVRSDDGGLNWVRQASGTTENLQSISAWDAQHALAVGNAGTALITEDGGATWKKLDNVPQNVEGQKYVRVRTGANGTAWIVGEFGLVARTGDHGRNWQSVGRNEDLAWNDIAFRDDVVLLAGEFGKLRRSADGGDSWTEIPSPRESSLMGIAYGENGIVVAVGLEGAILVSENAGESWKQVRSGTDEHLFDVIPDGGKWFATGDQGTYLSAAVPMGTWNRLLTDDRNYSWHMDAVSRNGTVYLAGQTLSKLSTDGKLSSFR